MTPSQLRDEADRLEFKARRTTMTRLANVWWGWASDLRDKADIIEAREKISA